MDKTIMKSIVRDFLRQFYNIYGWHTDRKIVVIESDDWGTIRMASPGAYNFFLKKGYPVDSSPYNRYDSLESNNDLESLFEVLDSVRDKDGNPAILTANNIVANPDFEKIASSGFTRYYFEPFNVTLSRYSAHDRVMDLYREGIDKMLIKPQYHGREHLNVTRWLEGLRSGDSILLDAFDCGMFSLHGEYSPSYKNEYMDAFDCDSEEQLFATTSILEEGADLFESIWSFRSESFIACCYIWHSRMEFALKTIGVEYIQGLPYQFEPKLIKGTDYRKIMHYTGQKNTLGQRYIVRNVFFEPTSRSDFDWVDNCLLRIETAFKWRKPAVISSHRLNFIGYLDPSNRTRNLKLLSQLLWRITKKWPQVEFMTTDQLGTLMRTGFNER